MLTFIVIGTAVAVMATLLASMPSRNPTRRERQYAASGDGGFMPWMDGGSSDCASGSSDGGCGGGDGGGGGGD